MDKATLRDRIADRMNIIDMGFKTPCWVSNRSANPKGYTQISVRELQHGPMFTHRAAWIAFRGDIPEGMHVDHLCKVRACCNPEHLEPVTPRENVVTRSSNPVAVHHRQGTCHRGHSTSESDAYINSKGMRVCRACRRLRDAKRRPRHRGSLRHD